MMEKTSAVYRFRVHGRVQGVSFRAFTAEQAERCAVSGWVANSHDGTVVGLASGSPEDLEALHQMLEQGPPAARVERVEWAPAQDTPPTGGGFTIRSDVAG